VSLTITAIEEVEPLELPAFLPTASRRRARDWLATAAAEMVRLERIANSPVSPAAASAGEARPRPTETSQGQTGGAAA
jgi:hypothetical protein